MKFLVVICCFSIVAGAGHDLGQELWIQFKDNYHKHYKNVEEDSYRYTVFLNNLQIIENHNKQYSNGLETYFLGINKFADLTKEEFRGTLSYTKRDTKEEENKFQLVNNNTLPNFVDWRSKGVVSEVKDQGKCNGCWAFSATGALEGQYAIKHGKRISLSEQELIDCSTDYGTLGCLGGRMEYAFQYVQYHGISTEKDYPFLDKDGVCRNDSIKRANINLKGYTQLAESEIDLALAVAFVGPISVGLNADQLQLYKGGIFNPSFCLQEMDHGVLVVGYGTEDGLDFWTIKNSWGVQWGEEGYFRIARNKNNLCAITCDALYPNFA